MKKNILKPFYLLLITTAFNINAYSQDYCQGSEWNWWNNNNLENWAFVSADQGLINWMGSIWTGPSKNVASIDKILNTDDYTPENGWLLLYRDFGCQGAINYPYFILYNKYRGKLRLFMLPYKMGSGQRALVTLRWADPSNSTSLLTNATGISKPNDTYHQSGYENNEVIASTTDNNMGGNFYSDHWFVVDFDLAFDQLTNPTKSGMKLAFDVSSVQNDQMHLSGFLDWITQPYTTAVNTATTNSDDNTLRDYVANFTKITKNLPSESDLKKIFSTKEDELFSYVSSTNATFGVTKIAENYSLSIKNLAEQSDLANFLTGVSKYGPLVGKYVNVAMGAFDFLTNKSNTTSPQVVTMTPTITHGTISLDGTITSTKPLAPIIIGLPGAINSPYVSQPYSNKPLGVIGLEVQPKLSIRRWEEQRAVYPNIKHKKDNEWDVLYSYYHVLDQWKSIRINDELKIALNGYANAEIENIKIALCASVQKKDDKPIYNLPDILSTYTFFLLDQSSHETPLSNPYKFKWNDYLNDNFYLLTGLDENGVFEFSTPFIDAEYFKGTSITVRKETDISLKILATLKAKDPAAANTPITILVKYPLIEPTVEDNTSDQPYPFTQAQLSQLSMDDGSKNKTNITNTTITSPYTATNWIIETSGDVTINSANANLFAYNSIVINPGTTIKGNVKLCITNSSKTIENTYTPINEIVKEYFITPSQQSSNQKDDSNSLDIKILLDEANHSLENSQKVTIYPNPTNGIIKIDGLKQEEHPAIIQVFNNCGKLVTSSTSQDGSLTIDLSSMDNGIYIVRIISKTTSTSYKISKN